MNKKNILKGSLLLLCSIPVICIAAYCGFQVHKLSAERADIKKDYADINSIENGLLSVDIWKDNIEKIAAARIQDFELTDSERVHLESEITSIFKTIINKTDSIVQNPHSFKGKIRKLAVNTFVDKNEFTKKAPQYSHSVVTEILKPQNKEKIKKLALEKLREYADQTYGDTAAAAHIDSVLAKYHDINVDQFNNKSAVQVDALQDQTYTYTYIMIGIILLFLLGWFLIRKQYALQRLFFVLSVVLALIVLLVGLTSPMIEIDARISKMDFTLMGEHLQFVHQVIFYQSKSILQVVSILLQTKAIDSTLVGILILVFSIVFPITKLITTQIHLLGSEKVRKNKFIDFFAIKSGKWSMADVMVVAIFMAYVGFKGILDHQLSLADYNTPTLHSISTNLTSLQPAYILFLGFVLYGLVLSEILKRIEHKRRSTETK